jgi:hypothetical protein
MTYNAKSRSDMRALAARVAFTDPADRLNLACGIMAAGLMRSQWWLHLGARFIRWRLDCTKRQAWVVIFHKSPAAVDEMLDGTAEWVRNGKDTTGEGVGGFNQAEVETLMRLIAEPERLRAARGGVAA